MAELGTMRIKSGLAEMLKGGVIMDVTTADQARIAEEAGAVAFGHGRAGDYAHQERPRRDAQGRRDHGRHDRRPGPDRRGGRGGSIWAWPSWGLCASRAASPRCSRAA